MFCPSCGTQIPNDALFCLQCGRSMSVAPNAAALRTPKMEPIPSAPVETADSPGQRPRRSSLRFLVLFAGALVVLALSALLVGRTVHSAHSSSAPHSTTTVDERKRLQVPIKLSPGDIASGFSGAVVILESYNEEGQKFSQGSGFIFSPEGKVLTNYHVIRGASRMQARMRDQSTHDVEWIVGYDIQHDLAALKIAGDSLPAVHLGNSAVVRTGDHVTALGAPLGLENTLSDGIISAVRQDGPFRVFQTSTPISHGSSGGPLFDDFGDVIALIVSTVEAGENLNFAVPIDSARGLLTSTHNTSFGELLSATTVRQAILDSSLSLPAQTVPVDLVVPKQGATLSGSFSITGGFGNDLAVRLIGPSGNLVWNPGVLQNSASLNLRLMVPGRYKLVFDNKVSPWWVSAKTISGTVELSYYR